MKGRSRAGWSLVWFGLAPGWFAEAQTVQVPTHARCKEKGRESERGVAGGPRPLQQQQRAFLSFVLVG